MPNLQHWLNAWVKVNTKQSDGHHHHSSGRAHHSTSRNRPRSGSGSGGGSRQAHSNEESPNKQVDPLERFIKQHNDGSLTTLTESLRGASRGDNYSGAGSRDGLDLESMEQQAYNAEQAAIRKFNSRKHRRKLYRTNSFSDMLREKARHRSGRHGSSNQRHAVEREKHQREIHQDSSRSFSKFYHDYHSSSATSHSRRNTPAPASLHDPPIPLEDGFPDNVSEASSRSASPAETTSTIKHSNKEEDSYQRYIEANGDGDDQESQQSRHSNALFEVADFFGANVTSYEDVLDDFNNGTNLDMRASSRPRKHSAQHGLGDEQPHYLRRNLEHLQHLDSEETSSFALNNISSSTNRLRQRGYGSSNSTRHSQREHQPAQYDYRDLSVRKVYPPTPPRGPQQYQPHSMRSSVSLPPPVAPSVSSRKYSGSSSTATPRAENRGSQKQCDAGLYIGGVRLPFFQNHSNSNSSASISSAQAGNKADNCPSCNIIKVELQHTQESLEYMREMAIRGEHTCAKCGEEADATTADEVKEASKQLSEVSERHKKQVEQLVKERNNWQRTMHQRLEKLSSLSESMRTETSAKIEQNLALQQEVEQLRSERDQMAGEIEQMRTAIQVFEEEREEHRLVQEKLTAYEDKGLQEANEAIAKRDDIISKLSARLKKTLQTLSIERQQQRQRRQIFFPKRNDSQQNSGDNQMNASSEDSVNAGTDEQEELKKLRAELLKTQQKVQAVQLEANQREMALQFRCEMLEKQLENKNN